MRGRFESQTVLDYVSAHDTRLAEAVHALQADLQTRHDETERLARALADQRPLGVAIGMIMAVRGVSEPHARQTLRELAADLGQSDVATAVQLRDRTVALPYPH